MPEKEERKIDLFDLWHLKEQEHFKGLKICLGDSFSLIYELLKLYDLLFNLSQKSIFKLDDVNQIPALLHSIAWMKHEAIAATMMMMRGHVTDSSNFTRRAFEIWCLSGVLRHDPD